MSVLLSVYVITLSSQPMFAQGTKIFKLDTQYDNYQTSTDNGYPPYPKFQPAREQHPKQATQSKQSHIAVPTSGVLPSKFLGNWTVVGFRTKAAGGAPKYQQALNNVMPAKNIQKWLIAGKPHSYALMSSAGASKITVALCTGNVAQIRHEFPVGNCIAHESYVLELDPSGKTFHGVMNCNVSKAGEPPPARFAAQYVLKGSH